MRANMVVALTGHAQMPWVRHLRSNPEFGVHDVFGSQALEAG